MKTRYAGIQDALAITLLAIGLVWGITRQFPVHAQQPAAAAVTTGALRVENGKLEPRNTSGSLTDTVNRWAAATTNAEWLGYSVAEVKSDRSVCCNDGGENHRNNCGPCRLESRNYSESVSSHDSDSATKINLEGPRELAVLYRAEAGKLSKIRIFSIECRVDAGGLNVVWLQNVKSSDSVSLLQTFVHGTDMESAKGENLGQSALTAIALHADPSADRALQSFVATTEPVSLRRESAFWLGEARGAEGFRTLQKMAQNDPSPDVRDQVAFALSVSKEPGALPEIIRMAHDDKSSRVRGQALFWLGQKAGQKAAKAITGSIDNDSDTEVKKKAVFALSQMPPDEGVPKLIQVAENNRNPQIRKEAMFWLGQSEDPQALAFFEKVLAQ
jgi:HEAT repeat protein